MSLLNSLVATEEADEAGRLSARVARLMGLVEQAEKDYVAFEEGMEATSKELERGVPAHMGLFTDTAIAVNTLRQQAAEVEHQERIAARAAGAADDYDESEDDEHDDDSRDEDEGNGDPGGSRKGASSSVRKMYKQIAGKCHPDKTDDPVLHELFAKAQLARDNNDGAYMRDLLFEVDLYLSGKPDAGRAVPDLVDRLLERQHYLSSQLVTWEGRLRSLKNTALARMHAMHGHPEPGVREQAKLLYKQLTLRKIAELEDEATRIRQFLLAKGCQPAA